MHELEQLADLIHQREAIDDQIAALIRRPALIGHAGEYIAAAIFDIELHQSATHKGSDGLFTTGELAGRSVNIKWYSKQAGFLDMNASALPDEFLVLAGPRTNATSSFGKTAPWYIESVYLFNAQELAAALQAHSIKLQVGTSLRRHYWEAAEIYPTQSNPRLILSAEQRNLLALFGSPGVKETQQPPAAILSAGQSGEEETEAHRVSLEPITDAAEIRDALARIWERWKEGAQPVEGTIGYQGGHETGVLYWRPVERVWAYLLPVGWRPESPHTWLAATLWEGSEGESTNSEFVLNRHWFCFGVEDPRARGLSSITCEINVPYEGVQRRCAGALMKDEVGQIYLTHSGKVGGGRPGIGKEAFLEFYREANRKSVLWPDGRMSEIIAVAELNAPHLAADIARFVHQVAAFKSHVTGR